MDATTIVECLHSFCRSCIVKYLQTSYHCPVCDVEVHKTKPLLHIRPDRTLQDIVYKIVPGIYHEEVNRRKEFEESQTDKNESATDETETSNDQEKETLPFEDPVCITLEYFRKTRNRMEKEVFPTRYLRCSSEVTVKVLKKFLVMKFAIPETHITEIIRSDEILDGHLTMKEVCRIYGLYSKPFVDLQFVFLEKNDSGVASEEKPKILEVKRKKIKKRKGNKNLLKKCLDSNSPGQLKKKLGKKKKSSSSQPCESGGKVKVEPSEPRSFENEKKENLGLSSNRLCSNIEKGALEFPQRLACDEVENLRDPNAEESNISFQPKANDGSKLIVYSQRSGNFNENEPSVADESSLNRLNLHDLPDASVNSDWKIAVSPSNSLQDSQSCGEHFSPTTNTGCVDEPSVTSVASNFTHVQLDGNWKGKEVDSSVSNHTNDVFTNHRSTELESPNVLLGLGLMLETL